MFIVKTDQSTLFCGDHERHLVGTWLLAVPHSQTGKWKSPAFSLGGGSLFCGKSKHRVPRGSQHLFAPNLGLETEPIHPIITGPE